MSHNLVQRVKRKRTGECVLFASAAIKPVPRSDINVHVAIKTFPHLEFTHPEMFATVAEPRHVDKEKGVVRGN